MTSPSALQADFERAWVDLGERLTSAFNDVETLAVNSSDAADYDRLAEKVTGLNDALRVWESLAVTGPRDDYAAAWRLFTDQVTALLLAEGRTKGFYQGVHLALTYQRGYGQHIDAPVILNPHNA